MAAEDSLDVSAPSLAGEIEAKQFRLLCLKLLFNADLADTIVGHLLKALCALLGGKSETFRDVVDFARNGTEYLLVAADGMLEHSDAQQASLVDVGIDGARRDEIYDGNGFTLLAVTVNATDPLLDPHGVPWEVIVDEKVAKLEIQPFAADL